MCNFRRQKESYRRKGKVWVRNNIKIIRSVKSWIFVIKTKKYYRCILTGHSTHEEEIYILGKHAERVPKGTEEGNKGQVIETIGLGFNLLYKKKSLKKNWWLKLNLYT